MLDGDATPPAVERRSPFDEPVDGGQVDALDPPFDDRSVAAIEAPVDGVAPVGVAPKDGWSDGEAADDEWSDGEASPSTWSQRQEPWSLLALVTAVVGAVPVTWGVPILSLAAVAFALVGLHQCDLHPARPNRWMAVVALGLGLLALIGAIVGTGLGRIEFLPFWTGQ